tara:strand:+ start:802 stop:1275 length:474 start_codon:yes stop_codon:yes gene_type:complete
MSTPSIGFVCSKRFQDFPCSHRQWKHPGHCRLVHGYSRSFTFWFAAKRLDEYGFVVDFSALKPLEKMLRDQFDHTFLVNADDPLLDQWKELEVKGALDLRIMENVGMESTAEMVWQWANEFLLQKDSGRTCCWRAEARENQFNSARFSQTPNWYESN